MITIENLDKCICDCEATSTNTQTYREFIRESEEEFGMLPLNLEKMSDKQLRAYLNFLDDLWNK